MSESSAQKILYIHPCSGPGGALEALLRLINELDRSKYYPKVLCPGSGPSYETFKNHGIEVEVETGIKIFGHATNAWYPIKRVYRLIANFCNIFYSAAVIFKVVKKENPCLVHLNSSVLLGPAIGAKMANALVVLHVREPLHDGYLGIRKRIIRSIIDRVADAVIAITETDARRLKPSHKVSVIYDAVGFDQFNRNIDGKNFRNEFKIKRQDKCIGMFGGIARDKGTFEFIETAKEIIKQEKDFKFFIVGPNIYSLPDTFKAKLKKKIKKLILEDDYLDKVKKAITNDLKAKIKIVGNRQDIPQIMAGSDLIVFPSIVSQAALPVIEAGAMAKPAVASNWGETAEQVVNGVTGFLVPPGDPKALSQAIIRVLDNPELAKKMGEEGYKRARELFDVEKNTSKVVRIYDKVLGIKQ